jgi:nucleoside-triphosphatase
MSVPHVLLVTGIPGVGKTTLLRRVAEQVPLQLGGFTTEEMRRRGERVGFRIVPLYGVDIAAIDAVAETALALDRDTDVYLVDEIGKMECFSQRFVAAVRRLLDSDKRLVASIAQKGTGFIAEVKHRPDIELWEVTVRNRDALVAPLLQWISGRRRSAGGCVRP